MGSTPRHAPSYEHRSLERLRAHWLIERELADRLRIAGREERSWLYGSVYDELFRRVPDHPQVVRRADQAGQEASAAEAHALIRRFLPAGGVFLEVGAGDCALSLRVAADRNRVYAVEVSREIAKVDGAPASFELHITDGRAIPVESGSVDLAYSNQLMEHLHPDDAAEQLTHILAALRPGGRYICLTPNRLLGPADISMYFEDDVASGFHLREYSNGELRELLRSVGFGEVDVLASLHGHTWALPMAPMALLESLFTALPRNARRRLKHAKLVRKALCPGGGIIARKNA